MKINWKNVNWKIIKTEKFKSLATSTKLKQIKKNTQMEMYIKFKANDQTCYKLVQELL